MIANIMIPRRREDSYLMMSSLLLGIMIFAIITGEERTVMIANMQ